MDQRFIQHGDDFVVITGNTRCTNGDCPYINEVEDCPGDIENCEYRQQRNDAFINYAFDGLRQSGNRCVAAHAIAHMLRIFATDDFLDEEGEMNIWQINKQKDVSYVEKQNQK